MAAKPNAGNIDGFMGKWIRGGLSGRKALEAFRNAGGRMADATFRQHYTSVRNDMLNHPTVTSLPGHRIPNQGYFNPWSAGQSGRFAYQHKVRIWDSGIQSVVNRDWTTMHDRPVSINKAIQQAIDEVNAGIEGSEKYKTQRVLGTTVVDLYETV